jgi:hypothetical protein
VSIGDCDQIYAIADEDMDRATEEKTSAVHFLRFQLDQDQMQAACSSQDVIFGVDHPEYSVKPLRLPDSIRISLLGDIKFDRK